MRECQGVNGGGEWIKLVANGAAPQSIRRCGTSTNYERVPQRFSCLANIF
jgi:hypothetical protein